MKEDSYFIFDWKTITPALGFTLIMWVVFYIERRFFLSFVDFGVKPGTLKGLRGVLLSPFIHSGISHLWSNTMPLLVLGTALSYFYRQQAFSVMFYGIILSGLLTWLIGRPSFHIGASGVIYMLVFFLFFKGIFTKYYRLIALSFLVAFFYGSLVWYVLPVDKGISWEGHLSGAVVGVVLAVTTRNKLPVKEKFLWEKPDFNASEDAFMQQFDENGNFFEIIRDEEE
jgi:membrane associated rhomboid family serine protease